MTSWLISKKITETASKNRCPIHPILLLYYRGFPAIVNMNIGLDFLGATIYNVRKSTTFSGNNVQEEEQHPHTLTINAKILYFWVFSTIILCGYSIVLYHENKEIKTVPVFLYAGPNAPQDIVAKINQSMEGFDEKTVENWYKDRVYDRDFQMAMFYSYLSNALAEKASVNKSSYLDSAKRDEAFRKSVELWTSVVKKDEDLVVFRDYFTNRYKQAIKNN